ncbi:hypothetical protein GRJ2_000298900 [Grus japonensis]|uniref:Uncharacterized protein n=1 Tax=Grus japonensis TaxID=30415 RepID=A0ABC9VZ33_GRUJA
MGSVFGREQAYTVTAAPSPDAQLIPTQPPNWERVPGQVISQVVGNEWCKYRLSLQIMQSASPHLGKSQKSAYLECRE